MQVLFRWNDLKVWGVQKFVKTAVPGVPSLMSILLWEKGRSNNLMLRKVDCRSLSLSFETMVRVTVLCSWAKHFTLTVPPSIHVYKQINLILGANLARD